MKTEITPDKLYEYFYPTTCFDYKGRITDYAEIAIIPDGIKKLENNLERYNPSQNFTEKEIAEMNDRSNDAYENIIAYVHFDTGTENFNTIYLEVGSAYDCAELNVDELFNDEEKQYVIQAGLESLRNARILNESLVY